MSNYDLKCAGFATTAIHAGHSRDPEYGALATPIFQTSTYCFDTVEEGGDVFAGKTTKYTYARTANPTVKTFEKKIAMLEGGEDAVATGSGMGAIGSALLGLLKTGDHIVTADTLYGCTDVLMRDILPSLGIETTMVDTSDIAKIEAAIRPNTKIIYFETSANPTMRITDVAAVVELKKKHAGIKLVVDNTFTPPPIICPITMGVDVVVHSVTKYLNGHGDVIGGVVVGSAEDIQLIKSRAVGKLTGTHMSPFNAYLIIRGMKTLDLRMRKHSENAMALAEFLEKQPYVEEVHYPGLPSNGLDHEVAKKQFANGLYSGMVAFEFKEGYKGKSAFDNAKKLVNSLELLSIGVSLGDPDSLIQHPASMTHANVTPEGRKEAGITDGLIRFSVGLEDVEDLIKDFQNAEKAL
jgi:methionine-gamma-lyase